MRRNEVKHKEKLLFINHSLKFINTAYQICLWAHDALLMINSERCINRSCGKFVNSALPGHQKLFNSSFKCMSNTVEHTMYASVYIYISYVAFGSASLYIKMLYFFSCTLALSVAASATNMLWCENSPIRYIWDTPGPDG